MKTLLILRHAKSDWNDPTLADHDRPLNKRGLKDAPRIGALLAKEGLIPDLIISSTATRAAETANLVAHNSGYHQKIQHLSTLYQSSTPVILNTLNQIPNQHQTILLVGHNPDLELLIEALTQQYVELSTATLVQLRLPLKQWQDISINTKATIENTWRPKEIN